MMAQVRKRDAGSPPRRFGTSVNAGLSYLKPGIGLFFKILR
jgi:hypothetical protein